MKHMTKLVGFGLLLLTACGGGAGPKTADDAKPAPQPTELSKDAQARYNAALDLFIEHDKKNDWNAEACASVAQRFEDVGKNATPSSTMLARSLRSINTRRTTTKTPPLRPFNRPLRTRSFKTFRRS
jgi:hypothetical protein